jgi:hypothetical protein
MPLLFFIDKDVLEDPACRNLDDIVLSYTFFKWVLFLNFAFAIVTEVLTSRALTGRDGMRRVSWNLMRPRIRYRHRKAGRT